MKGKYLYAIVKTPRMVAKMRAKGTPRMVRSKFRPSSEVEELASLTVSYRNLSAVIAETEYKNYHSLAKKEVVKELTSHQQTIEKIMKNFGTVLPVKFGTILKNEEEIKSVLEKGYSFLEDTLGKIEDKIELDLVCFWNEQKAAQMAYRESKKVRNFYKKITSEAPPIPQPRRLKEKPPRFPLAANSTKITLGKLVAQYLASKKKKLSSQILKVLKKEVVESCSHTLADINMLLNQAFLVEKENEERFNHALNQLDSKFVDLVNFRLVGPLPPYSFATVVIEALDREEVESAKKLLKLNSELTREKIKHAYNKLAMRHHPDKGGDPLAFEFVTQAYKLLRKFAKQGLVGVYLYKWEDQV